MIRLLIVDDDIATVEVIRDSINWDRLGIEEVHTAYNVAMAKDIVINTKIDIVISDIEMPQESGLDLLRWIREKQIECEIVLLTCHENFSYATHAINYDVASYLTKPFDIDIMEMTLQKVMVKLMQKQLLMQSSEYGIWMKKNQGFMKLDFWRSVFEEEWMEEERIRQEIEARHLEVETDKSYYLICTKFSNIEGDVDRFGKSLLEFVLEGFHSEILTGKVRNEDVIKFHIGDTLSFITISENNQGIDEKCRELIENCKRYFKGTVTCCISNPYKITEFSKVKSKIEDLFVYNISCLGKVFYENEVERYEEKEQQVIDTEKLMKMVNKNDKTSILRYLKSIFDELTFCKKLNAHVLYLMKEEIIQVTYTDLMKKGIQATKLFYDELSIKMADHALDSTIDMIRWVNYLLEKKSAYEEEVNKAVTIIDQINEYIHEHYSENIGRNEIASIFYLTPEYLAKLYKKKTGVNLKDYINMYRVEKAKELLMHSSINVSEVARAVGFDNFSYFSTLFKKNTGVSPKEYKNT